MLQGTLENMLAQLIKAFTFIEDESFVSMFIKFGFEPSPESAKSNQHLQSVFAFRFNLTIFSQLHLTVR